MNTAKTKEELNEFFRKIIGMSLDAIVSTDESGQIILWNQAAALMFGYTEDEALRMNVADLMPEEYRERHLRGIKRFIETEKPVLIGKAVEVEGLRKNGSRFPKEISLSAEKIGGKWVFTGIMRDITERKKLEYILERGKREWETTFDAISAPIFIHDSGFRIVRANTAYRDAAGMAFNELIGKPYFEVFPKMEKPFEMCLKAQESQKEEEGDVYLSSIDKFFKLSFFPIKDADGRYLYSGHIMEDITEAKRADEKIKQEMEITTNLLMLAEATSHTTNIDKLMEQVVYCICKILGGDICLSYLWDKEAGIFRPAQAYGLTSWEPSLFMAESLSLNAEFIKNAMDGKTPLVEQAAAISKLPLQWIKNINTIAAIPLIGKEGYLGLILGIYNKPAEISMRRKKVMQGIMHQVSTALEEARLYKKSVDSTMELSHKMETIQVMHSIDRSILSILEPQEILETVVRMIARVVPCDRATVALVDHDKGGLTYAAGFGLKDDIVKIPVIPFKDTIATEVIESGRPQYLADLRKIKGLPLLERRLAEREVLSHLRLPLITKGEVKAILFIGARRSSAFTSEDLSILEKMAVQIGVALENARLMTDLENLFIGTVKSLSSAIDAKSPWTAGHSERVTKYALEIGKVMGLSEKELKDIELAGLLHDVGKIGTYEAILDKPGKLSEEELALMKKHPAKGAEILSTIKQLNEVIPAIRHHHEFFDGRGYPDGLKGESIPLSARILAVADTVDAMGADRPYRKGKPMDAIIAELKRCSGTQFDPKVILAFLKIISNPSHIVSLPAASNPC